MYALSLPLFLGLGEYDVKMLSRFLALPFLIALLSSDNFLRVEAVPRELFETTVRVSRIN